MPPEIDPFLDSEDDRTRTLSATTLGARENSEDIHSHRKNESEQPIKKEIFKRIMKSFAVGKRVLHVFISVSLQTFLRNGESLECCSSYCKY